MERKYWVFPLVAVVGVALDQVTKIWVANYPLGHIATVIPHFLDIEHAQNPGAAFGMLGGMPEFWRVAVFLLFTLVASVFILDMWRRLPRKDWFLSCTLGLILSGAIGNAIDRLDKQLVTDFIRVYTDYAPLATWINDTVGFVGGTKANPAAVWPNFNIADSALFIGVGMFLIHYLFLEDRSEEPATAAVPSAPPAPSEE